LRFFPELNPNIFGLHCGDSFPEIPDSFLQGLTWNQTLSPESVVTGISAMTKQANIGLIIMATKGRDTLGKKILGSITEQVLRCSPCPVLAVPL
jgi:nucleotide-binding universal stress UspA family protein